MTEGSDVRDHLNDFFDTVDKLGDMNIEIHPDQLAIMLLYSLPTKFENVRCAIESRDDLPLPDALRSKFMEEDDAQKNGARQETSDAMFITKNFGRRNKAESRGKRKPIADFFLFDFSCDFLVRIKFSKEKLVSSRIQACTKEKNE